MPIDTDRLQLAGYLRLYGPMPGEELRNALRWESERFWVAVGGSGVRWFAFTALGWRLTDRGRDEAAAPPN
jgi:hypothetical protein